MKAYALDVPHRLDRRFLLAGMTIASCAALSAIAQATPKADPMTVIERLTAVEEIKKVKARYFRFVDTKRWDDLEKIFATDATFYFPESFSAPIALAAWMKATRDFLDGAITVHQGYMPEIEVLTTTSAEGIWAMSDHLYLPPVNVINSSEFIGAGHYHETYERQNGKWLIKTLKLTRLRTITVSLPKRVE